MFFYNHPNQDDKLQDFFPLRSKLNFLWNIGQARHQSVFHRPIKHSWASASRAMLPASVFQHSSSPSGTGAFQYQTGLPYPVADWFRHKHFLSFRCWTDRMLDNPTFRHSTKFYVGRQFSKHASQLRRCSVIKQGAAQISRLHPGFVGCSVAYRWYIIAQQLQSRAVGSSVE